MVEDSPSDAALLQETLSEAGAGLFDVTIAESLADAFQWLGGVTFDAMLLDLSLPDSSGRETFVRAHNHAPSMPIVLLTGAEDELIGLEAVRLGIQDYLIKGKTDGRQVARAIRYAIERRRAEDALQQSQRELRKAHEELEKRVEERTMELSSANRALELEIQQRQRAEAAHVQVLLKLNQAQEVERSRISRELHDQLGQELTALKLGLQLFDAHGPFPASAQQALGQLKQLSDSLLQSIHRIAWELRPTALDDFGLNVALERYCNEWAERTQVPVDFHSRGIGESRLPSELETTLYRVAREALTNVARHAKATRVSVLLDRRADQVSLILEDDGKGFDVNLMMAPLGHGGRLGLLGMRERVALAGGVLELESCGLGTTVFVRIPIAQNAVGGVSAAPALPS